MLSTRTLAEGVADAVGAVTAAAQSAKEAPPLDLVIVGAGVAGLQSLREALLMGLHVRVLERAPMPGGKWNGHGIYDCVQIQQHKHDFFLPDMPWPEDTPNFATRDDMVSATDRYIAQHRLHEHIETRAEVVSTTFDETAGVWTVTTRAGAVFSARHLAWAVGTLGPPNMPKQVKEALAAFEGDVVHSHEYYRPLAYDSQHVVVLGFGASSVEIAQDLARNGSCASVTLVAPPKVQADGTRQGQDWCLSRELPGSGSRFCAQGACGADATLEARNDDVLAAMAIRHPKYPACMPKALQPSNVLEGKPVYPGHDGRPLGGRVIVSEGFLDCVSNGSITCYPGYLGETKRLGGTHVTVRRSDGEPDVTLRCDAVVVCTGYEAPTKRIAKTMTPSPADCETLYMGTWIADVPNCALVGHVYGFVSVPPFAGLQARYLARVVAGHEALPSKDAMLKWVSEIKERYQVTQRLTENPYFRELRAANLGVAAAELAPAGAGPPERTSAAATGCRVDDGETAIALAAGEALTYLDEARLAGGLGSAGVREFESTIVGEIGLLAVGASSGPVADALAARLRPTERARLRTAHQPDLAHYPWGMAADRTIDLVLCQSALHGATPDERFVIEMLRVLKPGAHAVLTLREDEPNRGAWLDIFATFERPGGSGGKGDGNGTKRPPRWRMVHKTAPHADAALGGYRVFVFRSCARA